MPLCKLELTKIMEKFSFPTPVNPGIELKNTPIQPRILRELRELEDVEKLDPKESEESRNKNSSMFIWDDSLMTGEDRANLESIIVEFDDIFVGHR